MLISLTSKIVIKVRVLVSALTTTRLQKRFQRSEKCTARVKAITDRLWLTLVFDSDIRDGDSKNQPRCIVQFNKAVNSTNLVAGVIDVAQKAKEPVELLLCEKQ